MVLTLIKVFLWSHLLTLCTRSSSLYYCHHYDHCSVNIAIWYYMQTWSLYIIKRIYGLFACLCDSTSGYTDNSKPIFLFLVFVLENTVCLCGSCLSPSLSTEVLLVKLLLKQLQSARQLKLTPI